MFPGLDGAKRDIHPIGEILLGPSVLVTHGANRVAAQRVFVDAVQMVGRGAWNVPCRLHGRHGTQCVRSRTTNSKRIDLRTHE